MKKYLLPKDGQFYKANLHCHTTCSDGKHTAAEIKEIYQKDGEFFFITKGDNNNSEDKLPVSEDQLIGKAIFKIPYLALPTVWLHNINAKTQVEVETGN